MTQFFSTLYDKVLHWSRHRYAPWYLAGLSFSESSFFPIPPDVMLAPMAMAKKEFAWRYALITTIASVLGGVFGYLIGQYSFNLIEPYLHSLGFWNQYETVQTWFKDWGIWAILIAGFSPIPYKVFTIAAGAVGMAFFPFVIASAVGRGARFYLVATVVVFGGDKIDKMLRLYIDRMGWIVIVAVLILYFVMRGG